MHHPNFPATQLGTKIQKKPRDVLNVTKNVVYLCQHYLIQDAFFKFQSFASNRIYRINQQLSCTSKNVIYLASCNLCRKQYVGSTSTEFKVPFRNHKSSMINNKETCELAIHFNCSHHEIHQSSFIIIEKNLNHKSCTHLEQLLLTREAYWTLQLFTLQPHGLNKRREFKSKNRICYNKS